MQRLLDFRTRLMREAQARNFAKALAARSAFTNVTVQKHERAVTDKAYYVVFAPRDPVRAGQLAAEAQQARKDRAKAQAANYIFVLDESGRYYHCWNTLSGEVYEVTCETCTCPDNEIRLRGQFGIRCKHRILLQERWAETHSWADAQD